jgi:hypothetical protein
MAIVLDGTANTVTPLNGALGATTPSTVVATTVVASSTIKGATTIAVGNATPSASGAGITFPATQSASTDANTLDDYEEGTWVPAKGAGLTAVGTYSSVGRYTKIGDLVFVDAKLSATTSLSFNAAAQIVSNLPFTSSSTYVGTGTVINEAATSSIGISTYTVSIFGNGTMAATPNLYFSLVYKLA